MAGAFDDFLSVGSVPGWSGEAAAAASKRADQGQPLIEGDRGNNADWFKALGGGLGQLWRGMATEATGATLATAVLGRVGQGRATDRPYGQTPMVTAPQDTTPAILGGNKGYLPWIIGGGVVVVLAVLLLRK